MNQRELHADTHSFPNALRAVLREDPDVVLVGEMRDLETIECALRIAETGHLTLATLHTNSAVQTMNRVIDVFPASQQPQVRAQLSFVLEGILCQSLLPRASGKGRCMAMEILVPNARDPEPDPRGQAPPGLLDDADRTEQVRDADVQPVARDARPPPCHLPGARDDGVVASRRARRDDRPRGGRRHDDRRRRQRPPRPPTWRDAPDPGGNPWPSSSGKAARARAPRPAASSSPTRRTSRSRTSAAARSTSRPSRRRARSSPSRSSGPARSTPAASRSSRASSRS